jgi:alpha-1,3-rhamnosyl/mannosyltransferase
VKLLYDASSTLPPLSGVGRYSLELLRGLLRVWPETHPPPTVWFNSLRRKPSPQRHGFIEEACSNNRVRIVRTRYPGPVLLESWRWLKAPGIEQLTGEYYDVAHGPASYPFCARRAARVLTLHDLHYLRHVGHADRWGGKYLARALPGRLKDFEAVVVPAEAIRREVLEHFPEVSPERVHAIPDGVNHDCFKPCGREEVDGALRRRGITRPYALVVATLEPRKNLAGLFRAFARFLEQRAAAAAAKATAAAETPPPLLLGVGRPGWGNITLEQLLGESGVSRDSVVWLEDVEDAELARLYAGARVTVIPSLWEGFGLTALEAMACGSPVAASNRGGLPEAVGEAGVLFDPDNEAALAAALSRHFDAPEATREQWMRRGHEHARAFTWDATARGTLEVYRIAGALRRQSAR